MTRKLLKEKYNEEIARVSKLTGYDTDVSLDIIVACAKGDHQVAHQETKELVDVFNAYFDYDTFLEDFKTVEQAYAYSAIIVQGGVINERYLLYYTK